MTCIFCKIIAGEIPSLKVYEDPHVFAFLDIGPLSDGHCLVIPKVHLSRLDEAGPEHAAALAAVMGVIPALARAVTAAVGAKDWNLLENNGPTSGQVVGHVHFHIIPRREADGLGYRWNAGKLDPKKGAELARVIAGKVNG